MAEIKEYCKIDVPVVLVGNKIDLRDSLAFDVRKGIKGHKLIHPSDVKQLDKRHNVSSYLETSAKCSTNVDEIFETALYYSLCEQRAAILCKLL